MKGTIDPQQKGLHRRLTLIKTEMHDDANAIEAMKPGPELDHCLLKQNEEHINSLKSKLEDISHNIITLDDDDTGLADRRYTSLKAIFNMHHQIRWLLQACAPARFQEGIKLAKLDVPIFKGDVMEWQTFWEQFSDLVHSKPQLFNPVKLAYLQQALKDGPARRTIEGLSGLASNYHGAITMLQECYDRPAYSIKHMWTW